jgi:hypothetical protein
VAVIRAVSVLSVRRLKSRSPTQASGKATSSPGTTVPGPTTTAAIAAAAAAAADPTIRRLSAGWRRTVIAPNAAEARTINRSKPTTGRTP